MTSQLNIYPPLYRLVPASLKPRFESGDFNAKHLFLVSELTGAVLKPDVLREKYLPKDLTSGFLKDTLSSKYREVVDFLIAEDVLKVRSNLHGVESYSTEHHHCKQYRLTKPYQDELVQGGVASLFLTDHRQLKRIAKYFEKTPSEMQVKYDWFRLEMEGLAGLRFEKESAELFVKQVWELGEFRGAPLTNGRIEHLWYGVYSLDHLLNSDTTPWVSFKHGRVFHSLVHANREFRQFVKTIDGEPLMEIDMRSCQFIMLCKALALWHIHGYEDGLISNLERHIPDPVNILEAHPTHTDLHQFVRAVVFQDIYTDLGLLKKSDSYTTPSGFKPDDRKDWKHEAIAKLLYDYYRSPEPEVNENDGLRSMREVLRTTYPDVHRFIKTCAYQSKKKKASSDLAVLMQEFEGYFFHQVLQRAMQPVLQGKGYVIIHDAIYVPESAYIACKEVYEQCVEEFFMAASDFSSSSLVTRLHVHRPL